MDKISLPFRILLVVFAGRSPSCGSSSCGPSPRPTSPARTPAPRRDRPGQRRGQGEERRRRRQRRRGAQRGRGQRRRRLVHRHQAFRPSAKPAPRPPHGQARQAAVKPPPAKPGLADDAAPGDPSGPLLASVDAGKVVVLLFWNKNASDDRADPPAACARSTCTAARSSPARCRSATSAATRPSRAACRSSSRPPCSSSAPAARPARSPATRRPRRSTRPSATSAARASRRKKAFASHGLRQGRRRRLQGLRLRAGPEGRPADDRPGAVQGARHRRRGGRSTRATDWPRSRRPLPTSASSRRRSSPSPARTAKWIADAQRKLKAGAEPGDVFLTLVPARA